MAKSRAKARGATRGRPRRKMLGKGCSTKNKTIKGRIPKRVHLKFPAC